MEYEIFGRNLPAVTITLEKGETINTQTGTLAWMTDGIEFKTEMKGGFFAGLKRAVTGNSMFLSSFVANREYEKLTLSTAVPGEIRAFEIDHNHTYIAQKGAFLASTDGVEVETVSNKSLKAGLFGGEGIFLQQFTGNGIVFVELDGSIKEIELAYGEKILVAAGHVALFEDTVQYSVQSVKGASNILFSGTGLFLTELTGPGKVYLQSMNIQDMANRLKPYLPTSTTTVTTSSSSSSED